MAMEQTYAARLAPFSPANVACAKPTFKLFMTIFLSPPKNSFALKN